MSQSWLLTWTTYGTWLPGDVRGFVTDLRGLDGVKVRHNSPGTDCDRDIPGLVRYSQTVMRGEPVYLSVEQAESAAAEFRQTAAFRSWDIEAVAIMRNHVHIVVSAHPDWHGTRVMSEFKSYASRAMNATFGKRTSGTWWTKSGSKPELLKPESLEAAIVYVRCQDYPLFLWLNEGPGETPEPIPRKGSGNYRADSPQGVG